MVAANATPVRMDHQPKTEKYCMTSCPVAKPVPMLKARIAPMTVKTDFQLILLLFMSFSLLFLCF